MPKRSVSHAPPPRRLFARLAGLAAGRKLDSLLNHVLEQHPDAVMILDGHTTACRRFNNRALVLTGYSRQALSQRRLDDLFPPEHARAIRQAQEAFAAAPGQRLFTDVPLITQSGNRRYVDLTLTGIAQPPAFMLTARLADRRKAEEAAEADRVARIDATLELTQLLDEMPDEIWDEAAAAAARLANAWMVALYVENESEDAMLLEASHRVPPVFPARLPVDYEPASDTWDAGLAGADPLATAAQAAGLGSRVQIPLGVEEGARGLVAIGYRARAAYRNEALHVELVASLLASLVERRLRAEAVVNLARAHHSQNTLLEQMQEIMTCGLVMIDADGCISLMNGTAQRLLGYPEEDVYGRRFDEVLVSRSDLKGRILRAMDEGVSAEGEETTLVSREGVNVPVWLRVAPVWPGADLEESVLIVFDDRSHHKAMEDRSRHLEQLSFLGEMSAIFAHEIRNPLASISTGVQYLASKIPADDPLQETLSLIHTESNRLNRLLEDILSAARPKPVEATPIDLATLVAITLARWESRLKRKRIEVRFNAEDNLPRVLVAPRELEQVLSNLFTNAIQAMSEQPGHGVLSVSVGLAPGTLEGPGYQGPRVQITVSDTGPGMSPEVKRRAFELFFTTKPHGTGLGLAISRRIIMQYKGTLEVESWEGVGTVFTIALPAAETDIELSTQITAEEGAPDGRHDSPG